MERLLMICPRPHSNSPTETGTEPLLPYSLAVALLPIFASVPVEDHKSCAMVRFQIQTGRR